MNESYFIEYLAKWFAPLVNKVTELINGKKDEEALLHKTMLTEEFSADLKWGSREINGSVVAADVVSMESSLPLKKRDSITAASGDIPKIGLKLRKGEKTISDIQVMQATGVSEYQIAQKIFDDIPRCIKGIDVRKEIMFQQGLSSGVTLVEDTENTGVGIRVDFGYKAEHLFRSKIPWGNSGYVPQDDIDEVFDAAEADGNKIALVMMSQKYFNLFKNSTQGKVISANYSNYIYTSTSNLPVPSRANFLAALEDLYGARFIPVNSSFRIEKNGVQSVVRPWVEANIVFLYDNVVGRLVYGNVAEKNNPVAGVTYQEAGQGTLVSKYSKTDPLEEFTMAQALALPVIDGASSIYLMEANKAALAFDPTSLSFAKTADATGKVVTVTTDAASLVSAVPADGGTWATMTITGLKVKVKVAANEEVGAPERTTTITVTDSNGDTGTFTVTQAANA
jgi:hypothetical protein